MDANPFQALYQRAFPTQIRVMNISTELRKSLGLWLKKCIIATFVEQLLSYES